MDLEAPRVISRLRRLLNWVNPPREENLATGLIKNTRGLSWRHHRASPEYRRL